MLPLVEDPTYRALFWFQWYVGTRLGETHALLWEDVDLDERKAFICRGLSSGRFLKGTKTEQDRWVHLAPDVIPILREQRKRCGGALVFPIDRYGLYPSLKKAQKEAEVRHFPIKALRSGHVTAAIAAGVAPTDVQKQVGHSNVTTTLRKYTGATDKDYTDEGGL